MSDSDEENFCLYGTPLDPLDEDEIPSKKPINIEDQIATDAYGRRRFHGAFTGGFSAGFYNTVGSLEGWIPKDFKSSKSLKATKYDQKPEDFMDDEDIAEHGFAPQGLRTTDDYNSIKSRAKKRTLPPVNQPIPGQPVLQLLLEPVKETIGVKLLKQMGWKPGQGVGPRLTKTEKKKLRKKRIIGCEMPPDLAKNNFRSESDSNEEYSDDDYENITFAPDDYDPYICKPKEDSCGLGYKGLNKNLLLNDFSTEPGHFTMVERNNKKVSIQGQAFGVGAFEEDDEDIYSKDDMSKYDFELGYNVTKSQQKTINSSNILDNFVVGIQLIGVRKNFPPPILPKSFIPKHGVRISRFEPLSEDKLQEVKKLNQKTLEKQKMNAEKRSQILEDTNSKIQQSSKDISKESVRLKPTEILNEIEINPKPKIIGDHIQTSEFKPFIADPDKQERYEKYLEFIKNNTKHKLSEIQPISMTDWEQQREEHEFDQAAKMFKPKLLNSLVFDKFVTAQHQEDLNNPLAPVESIYQHGTPNMREAAKRKMFGKLTREEISWNPGSLLCKRFNVPEPNIDNLPLINQRKKKGNISVFDYLNTSEANQYNKGEISNMQKINDESLKLKDKIVEFQKENQITKNDNLVSKISDEIVNLSSSIPSTSKIGSPKLIEETNIKSDIEKKNDSKESTIEKRDPSKQTEKIVEDVVLHTERKIDLYKAIFLGSENSESESDEPECSNEILSKPSLDDLFKNDLLSEVQTIQKTREKLQETKDNEIFTPTVEKSNVPLVQMKQTGIFANIDLDVINKRPEYKKPEVEFPDVNENVYGPKLPTALSFKSTITPIKYNNLQKEKSKKNSVDEDLWIEKSLPLSEKSKYDKKSKKKSHKHKHKKSRHNVSHKHKRKKHSDDSN